MTAPVITQPDLESWVFENLSPLSGVTCFAIAAAQMDGPGWIYSYSIQVDARAGRKAAARDLAEQARQVILGLRDLPWADGVVCYAQATEGPFWLADPNGGPRYTARYEIRVHPARNSSVSATEPPVMPRPGLGGNSSLGLGDPAEPG